MIVSDVKSRQHEQMKTFLPFALSGSRCLSVGVWSSGNASELFIMVSPILSSIWCANRLRSRVSNPHRHTST